MEVLFSGLVVIGYLLTEVAGYTTCSYRSYDVVYGYRTRYYTCSNSEYCCGTRSCCMATYARWYLWFVLAMFFLIAFFIWWYYRYRYRPRHAVVTNVATVPTIQTTSYPAVQTTTTTFPSTQINMGQHNNIVHYSAYPAQAYSNQPPPPYSVATTTVYN